MAEDRRKAVSRLEEGYLPDTDLAPLTVFDRKALVCRTEDKQDVRVTKQLTLALGQAYSDLKDCGWALQQIAYGQRTGKMPDAYLGQHHAMLQYFFRMMCGHVHEVIGLTEKSDAGNLPPVKRALRRVKNAPAKQAWKELVDVPKGTTPHTETAKFLYFARNSGSFHYDRQELAKGYREYAEDTNHQLEAYESLGETWEQTRFYFSDAAAQRLTEGRMKKHGVSTGEWRKLLDAVNYGLRFVIVALVEELCATQGLAAPRLY